MSETEQSQATDAGPAGQGSLAAESRHHDLLADMANAPVRSFEELLSEAESEDEGERLKPPGEKTLIDKAERDDIKENKDDNKNNRDDTGKEASDTGKEGPDTGKEATDSGKEGDTGKEASDPTGKEATDKSPDKAEDEKIDPDKLDDDDGGFGDDSSREGRGDGQAGAPREDDDPDAQIL